MENLGLNALREKFLRFFEERGHYRLPSFPLIPQNDKSILLINAGMTPMKPFFTGEQTPPSKRVTTCQKCVRTLDIDNVGKTSRHGTFFEMLGNFSFGDYFKKEVIPWAWDFITKEIGLPEERLYVTIYLDDDEAYRIWTEDVGVDPSHISRMGKEDNFWDLGQGPCGPCSEIHYDRGADKGCGKPDCKVGCECDRFVEIWNLVFTQFDNDGNGNYARLKNCNIDTGMGLERLAMVVQGADSIFDVDTFRKITAKVCEISGKKYGKDHATDVSMRIITDHIRSTVFLVGDGVLPSNEGRGYILRRLLRRAARHGKLLGIANPEFLAELSGAVIQESGQAYPELEEKREYIKTVIAQEENRFNQTIDGGLEILGTLIQKALAAGQTQLDGKDAFRLYDTFGFPIDLTREILEEKNMTVDETVFDACMKEQKARARQARMAEDNGGWKGHEELKGLPQTTFLGYETLCAEATVLKIVEQDGGHAVILDQTPFYAESGGQAGDRGTVGDTEILDCKKNNGIYLHLCKELHGLQEGGKVSARVNETLRRATMRNHSAAHLLQAALKNVLGGHITQAGSFVDEHRMRFDFSHFAAMTSEQISQVEKQVNEAALSALPVSTEVLDIEEAKKTGATALFGEKYGAKVRVVKMGDVSAEFCGGTHVANTAQIGLFKILSESGVAAGVRRIEALTGYNILSYLEGKEQLIAKTAEALKTNASEIAAKAEALSQECKQANRLAAELEEKMARTQLLQLESGAEQLGAFTFITGTIDVKTDILRSLCDQSKEKDPNSVILLFSSLEGKVGIACACGKQAIANGANAGKLVKEAAQTCGGGGGGRPDSASAGGKDPAQIPAAAEAVRGQLRKG